MGLLSSLFGKKDSDKTKAVATTKTQKETSTLSPTLHLKGSPDTNGLYPSELVMLSYAEKLKTNETNFPASFTNNYEITNPEKMLKSLQLKGLIKVGTAKDVLDDFKLPELKEIASSLGIPV